jgi:uncharacterized iron-regulated membrane protein
MVRAFWVFAHRWVGLAMAGFLVVVGLTGSLLAFLPELNHWLAPQLHPGPHGVALDAATIARRAEILVPHASARTVYLGDVGAASIGMVPRSEATPLDFSSLVLDAVTGEELGRLQQGALPTALEQIMPFVYQLHMNLALGETGAWILGITALVWTFDCFIALYLTLPRPSRSSFRNFVTRWKPAWLVKWRASAYRINFDLHRAGGLWVWPLLLVFAWSSVFFNLNEVYMSATKLVLDIEPPPWMWPAQPARGDGRGPLEWEEARAVGERLMAEQAREHGFTIDRPDALYFRPAEGLVQYRVHSSRDIGNHYGATSVLFDAYTGVLVAVSVPSGQYSGNTVTSWLVALHTADVFGLPYRLLVCALGLVLTMLSATGVYIWWKKRRARKFSAAGCDAASGRIEAHHMRVES